MDAKEQEKWREVRAKGERRRILKNGLQWALCFGAGHFLVGVISKRYLRDGWNHFILFDVVLIAFYFFLGGCLVGIWDWRRNEKQYSQVTPLDEA